MLNQEPTHLTRYGFAVVVTILAMVLTQGFQPWLYPSVFPLFFAAVMLSAWFGGLGPGLLATLVAATSIDFFLLPPHSTRYLEVSHLVRISTFVLVALLTSSLTAARKRAEQRLRNAQQELEQRVQQRTTALTTANDALRTEIDERKQVEAVLRYQAQIIDQIHDSVIATDLDGRITSWNKGAQRLFGYAAQEMLGKRISALYAEDQQIFLREQVVAPLREKGAHEVEVQMHRKSKENFYAHVLLSLLRDPTGVPTGMIGYSMDITARKQAEHELQARLRQQAAVATLGQQALSGAGLTDLMDTAMRIVAQTLEVEYAKILELLPEQNTLLLRAGVGWKAGAVGHTIVSAGSDSQAGYTLLTREPVITEDLRTETRFSGPPLLHEYGVISGLSVIIAGEDIPFGVLGAHTGTQRTFSRDDIHFLQAVANVIAETIRQQRTEETLRENEERLRGAFDYAPIGKALVDFDGRPLRVNRALCQILGYTEQELLATTLSALTHPQDTNASQDNFHQLLTNAVPSFQSEKRYIHKSEREVWTLESVSLVRDAQDNPLYWITQIQDISERKAAELQVAKITQELVERNQELWRLQREMSRVESLAALGQVTGKIAHELGTPLNSVLGYARLLAEEPLSESVRSGLQTIETQAQRMVDIIQHYLSRTRDAARRHQQIAVDALVQDTLILLKPMLQQHEVQVRTALATSLPFLQGDEASLQRVLINLLNNAIDALEDGGNITITARTSSPPETARSGVLIEVTDTGSGIPPEVLPHLFDLFVTTKASGKGTGLGLAICQEIIRGHGGNIAVTSQVGQGTSVRIFLPVGNNSDQPVLAEHSQWEHAG
ncbi:MAG: PAS domain S-box protein [Candidatus Binatia bacterium]